MASRSDPDYISLAKNWAENNKYKLESIEESNKKFTFKCNSLSFYVYAPENDTEGWVSVLLISYLDLNVFVLRMYGAIMTRVLQH